MLIFGLTRYSVLSATGLRQTRDFTYEERVAHLLSDERLAKRMRLFQAFVAPELQIMSKNHQGFRHLVFVSPELPAIWLKRLRKSLAGIRHKIVSIAPEENLKDKARASVADFSSGAPFFTFRVDDDDALPSGYLDCILSNQPTDGTHRALSFDEGYFIRKRNRGSFAVELRSKPLIAIGLGLYSPAGAEPKTIFCLGNHKTINQFVPVTHLASPHWLRTIHDTNDSEARVRNKNLYTRPQLKRLLTEEFPALTLSRVISAL